MPYLYSEATTFNDAMFVVNDNEQPTQVALAGGFFGPIEVRNILSSSPTYKFQITATFGSGEAGEGEKKEKKQGFTTNIPVHKKKVFKSPPKNAGPPASVVKAWEK